jgi:hypothetical protein
MIQSRIVRTLCKQDGTCKNNNWFGRAALAGGNGGGGEGSGRLPGGGSPRTGGGGTKFIFTCIDGNWLFVLKTRSVSRTKK